VQALLLICLAFLCDVLCIVSVVVDENIEWQAMSLRIVRKRKSNVDLVVGYGAVWRVAWRDIRSGMRVC
jgi:hypothetical protein